MSVGNTKASEENKAKKIKFAKIALMAVDVSAVGTAVTELVNLIKSYDDGVKDDSNPEPRPSPSSKPKSEPDPKPDSPIQTQHRIQAVSHLQVQKIRVLAKNMIMVKKKRIIRDLL